MNVLIIPEDFRKDQYVLKPVVESLLSQAGRPNARVVVLKDPLLGGVTNALDWNQLEPILERYRGMIDLFLLIVDRDGVKGRAAALRELESRACKFLPARRCFLAEAAVEEVEVWALAGHDRFKGQW